VDLFPRKVSTGCFARHSYHDILILFALLPNGLETFVTLSVLSHIWPRLLIRLPTLPFLDRCTESRDRNLTAVAATFAGASDGRPLSVPLPGSV
jgi:hypothetical protein